MSELDLTIRNVYSKMSGGDSIYASLGKKAFLFSKDDLERSWATSSPNSYVDADIEPKESDLRIFRDALIINPLVQTGLCHPSLGSDPEFFISDGDGKVIPAFTFLPEKTPSTPIFWDGYQCEVTPSPRNCIVEHATLLCVLLKDALRLAKQKNKDAQFLETDTIPISLKELKKKPTNFTALGCDPSSNAYGMEGEIPADSTTLPFRFAGGHIHFGWEPLSGDNKNQKQIDVMLKAVRDLDKILAIWSVGAAQSFEKMKERRRHYGLAGEFRLPSHGLEYRTLSPFWLKSPEAYHITFDLARAVFRGSLMGLLDFWVADMGEVIRIINEYDQRGAQKILEVNKAFFIHLAKGANHNYLFASNRVDRTFRLGLRDKIGELMWKAGIEGIESVTPKKTITENWLLEENISVGGKTWGRYAATILEYPVLYVEAVNSPNRWDRS